ncbi:MAG: HAD hydrolase-like protein, partial [Bacteroidales bacterium]|nr:HAD hydrolase-like protein [Bacteroidales bacterium]
GKPRYKGVESFLLSRRIELPYGEPGDKPGNETICGLGNRKNQAFNEVLERDGVAVYPSTVALIKELLEKGIRVGVASSSKNCESVLRKTGLIDFIETRVDGVVSAELGLKGKPEADIFTTACDNLEVPYDKAVVVEDAVSGVQAGRSGNFGFVLGVARENNEKELFVNGADLVVTDIEEIGFEGINKWFEEGLEQGNWSVSYKNYEPEKEKTRESLLSIGNGYFGTRGAFEECDAGEWNYPGTYIAGLYNRLVSKVGNRNIENEDFVNCPDWTSLTFKIDNGAWIDPNKEEILEIFRNLDFRTGVLYRKLKIKDEQGRITLIESERFVSMDNPHLAGISYSITPVNYSEKIVARSGMNGNIINDGVARYRQLNRLHLEPEEGKCKNDICSLTVKTSQSGILISQAVRHKFLLNNEKIDVSGKFQTEERSVFCEFGHDIEVGGKLTVEKTVSVYTSQDWDSKTPENDAVKLLMECGSLAEIKQKSAAKWAEIWGKVDIKIEGDRLARKLIRLHIYHLMVSFSPNNVNFDASVTARGLHGEAYRGHIFWDELFILPLYNLFFPEVVKSALLYRYRRLEKARKYAKEYGYKGAMFPWQSGSDGREETQVMHLNPLTGKWGADFSSLQRHVSLAINYNIWNYFHNTRDVGFLEDYAAEMFFEICRFWADKSVLNENTGRYEIKNVMGPDEFHEKYPGSEEGGLKDNAYTNLMVAWSFNKANELFGLLGENAKKKIESKTGFTIEEVQRWKDIASKLNLVIKDDIIAQYDGYFELDELDWDYFRGKYGNIYRMDRLLKAEGKSADHYKVTKQADTLQTFYNLDENEVSGLLKNLGYAMTEDYLTKNLQFYLQRTSHGSTLSRVVHAQLANKTGDKNLSWNLYLDALTSDYQDKQGGTTGEGIHAGVMAGTVLVALQSYAGLDLRGDVPKINPDLPGHWRSMEFRFDFKGIQFYCKVMSDQVRIRQFNTQNKVVKMEIAGKIDEVPAGIENIYAIS